MAILKLHSTDPATTPPEGTLYVFPSTVGTTLGLSQRDSDGVVTTFGTGGGGGGSTDWSGITNKPTIVSLSEAQTGTATTERLWTAARVAAAITAQGFDGAYASLTGKPTIPTLVSQLTNDSSLITAAGAPVQTVAGRAGNVTLATTDISGLATVATSGAYVDLTDKPTLFSGSYNDLTDLPTLFSGAYSALTGKPTLATVSATGDYADLLNTPTLFSGAYADLTGKPTLFDGTYGSLSGKPTLFSGSYNDLSNLPSLFDGTWTSLSGKPVAVSQVEAETGTATTERLWTAARVKQAIEALSTPPGGGEANPDDVTAGEITAGTLTSLRSYTPANIKAFVDTHGFDGAYSSLIGKPTLFSESYNDLTDLPTLFDGVYASLTGKPTIPTLTSQLTNDAAFITAEALPTAVSELTNDSAFINAAGAPVQTVAGRSGAVVLAAGDVSGLATVATTGAYGDLSGTPTAPVSLTQVEAENPASTATGLATGQRIAQAIDARIQVVANGAVPAQGTDPAGTIYIELDA